MRNLDFSSWQAVISTVLGLGVITLIGVGIRLLITQAVQQRRERENRQINERLRTLIAAYKVLGGSFTGNLAVDPAHLRDLRRKTDPGYEPEAADPAGAAIATSLKNDWTRSDRPRRIRDAVEASLSDVILLGTEDQVRLAANAATELAEGRPAHTAELVISLRDFIREVLDLDPVPTHLSIPKQGPARPAGKGAAGGSQGGEKDESKQSGKDGGKGGGAVSAGVGTGAGMGMGMGVGLGGSTTGDDDSDQHR